MDHNTGQIDHLALRLAQKPQYQVIICRDSVGLIEGPDAIKNLATQIEGRVRRHPALMQQGTGKGARVPIADHLVWVPPLYIQEIAVYSFNLGIGKGGSDATEYMGVGIEIVAVQKTDDIAARPFQALIQGMIDALIRLADHQIQLVMVFLKLPQGSVRTGPIDDDVLMRHVGLLLYRG